MRYRGMQITENRLKHSLSVARKIQELVEKKYPNNEDFIKEMFMLGFLHDVGYEYCDNQKDHAEVGGNILKGCGYKYWEEIYYHGKVDIRYKSEALDLLNTADLQIDGEGNEVTVVERLKDVKIRYGEDSEQYKDFVQLAKELGFKIN